MVYLLLITEMVINTKRPFRERFLDGFNRSQLREEVQKVHGSRKSHRKRMTAWALGASLAVGGLGIPLKLGTSLNHSKRVTEAGHTRLPESSEIKSDLKTAAKIATEVTAGATGAIEDVTA